MNKLIKTFVVVLFVTIITSIISCSTFRDVDTSKIKIGMSKTEVKAALRMRPYVVAAKHLTDPESIIEIIQYSSPRQGFYLYFLNDKLEKWRPVMQGEDRPIL